MAEAAPRIVLQRLGRVDDTTVDQILCIAKETYASVGPPEPELVDLLIFGTSSLMDQFLRDERTRRGVASLSVEEDYLATHDAWTGIPRILVSVEKLGRVPSAVARGAVRHEVGHTILHGSMEFYAFPIPREYTEISALMGANRQSAIDLLSLTSTAVKDYEVTRLLVEHGFTDDQEQFGLHFLHPSSEDVVAYSLAKGTRKGLAAFLLAALKPLGCAAPLAQLPGIRETVLRAMNDSLGYLPQDLRARLVEISVEGFASFNRNTSENVRLAARLIANRLLRPTLGTLRSR